MRCVLFYKLKYYLIKGNPVSAKEGGAKTSCEYESGTSLLKKYTASTGVETSFMYESGTHNVLRKTTAGVMDNNTYDEAGLLIKTNTYSSDWSTAQRVTNEYDPYGYGYKTSTTDGNWITTTYGYWNHYLTSVKIGDGAEQKYSYNDYNGRLESTSVTGGGAQYNNYANGQLSRLARNDGVKWQSYMFGYDSFGNMKSVSVSNAANTGDASKSMLLANYDYGTAVNNGLLQKMTYANEDTVSYEYDIFDRTTKETYNNGVAYNYYYDSTGALSKQSSSSGEEYRYEYDSLGRLIRSSEYNNNEFVQRTEQIYDDSDRLTQQSWYNGSGATSQTYKYSETNGLLTDLGIYYPDNTYDGTPNVVNNPSVGISYTYNGINMLTGKTVTSGGSTVYSKTYTYRNFWTADNMNNTTNQVKALSYGSGLTELDRQYTYDGKGNIATETGGGTTYKYTYDTQNQLTEVENGEGTTLYSYEYDKAGNLLSKTDGSTTHTYAYGNEAWADLLTSYDGKKISYDEIGNPTSYYNGKNWKMTWENGRQLSQIKRGSKTWDFTYDMAGVRSGKTVTTTDSATGETTSTEYKYTTLSGKLVRVEYNTTVLDIVYDEAGQPFSIRYKGKPTKEAVVYYYVLNAQGDVVGLLNAAGELVVEYEYDPWGKLLNTKIGVDEAHSKYEAYNNMGLRNPLRYRGYIYDRDTGLYYLQSRYYDPAIGRFINADTYTTTDASGILSTNMFAYCENNPVMGVDYTREFLDTVFDVVSLCISVAEVVTNPADPWAWAGLVGDVVDLVPGVTGVGETVRLLKTSDKVVDIAKVFVKAANYLTKSKLELDPTKLSLITE